MFNIYIYLYIYIYNIIYIVFIYILFRTYIYIYIHAYSIYNMYFPTRRLFRPGPVSRCRSIACAGDVHGQALPAGTGCTMFFSGGVATTNQLPSGFLK
jgi:hypothetical protein